VTAGEKQSRQKHGGAMIETMDHVTTVPSHVIHAIEQIKRAKATFAAARWQRIECFDHFNPIKEASSRPRAAARSGEERHFMAIPDQISP
jgi:hypothetical protein